MKPSESKYFLAIIPPEPLQSQIQTIKEHFQKQFHSKGALRSPAHITLHMPFLWKLKKEENLIHLLAQASNYQEFTLKLNGFGAFAPKTIFIKNDLCSELESFQRELSLYARRNLNLFNSTHNNGFNPHLTVAFRDLKKEMFFEAWTEFEEKEFTAEFNVSSFWLLKHDGQKWHAYREFPFGE